MIQQLIFDLLIILSLPLSSTNGPGVINAESQLPDCAECHDNLLQHEVIHYPVEDACENCHESTGASHPPGDSAGFRLMDHTPALCYYCHEEQDQGSHPHPPVVRGNCLGCHDAHGSSESSLLRSPDPDLCLSCHNRSYTTDSKVTANIGRLVNGRMNAHSAIAGGGCLSCHQAHGSEFRMLLVEHFPVEDYVPATTENFGLCFLCHDTDLLDAEETKWATGFRDSTTNLHWLHINGNKGRNCRMCHNIHGSPQPFLIEEVVGFGNWEMRMNFDTDEQGGSCLPGCHGEQSYRR